MQIHIVIPCYNHWELTHARLWELYKQEKNNIASVTIVDNGSGEDGSTDETRAGLKWWQDSKMFYLDILRIEDNRGFLFASNEGLRHKVWSTGNQKEENAIILLSNDVQILHPFIPQTKEILSGGMKIVGGKLLSQDTGWNKFGETTFPYLEGWLLAAKAIDWEVLGYFDERFAPQDYEDVDFSSSAIKMGYELVPLNNSGLIHLGAQTYGYNPEREAQTNINKKKFEAKWLK